MKVIARYGTDDLANVYLAETGDGHAIEFVDSIQPPLDRSKKWVLIVSTLAGCPVNCIMCDAGGGYNGTLSAEDIFAQIDHAVTARFPDRSIPIEKFKIQMSRMGEPSFNPAVLEVLHAFPHRYDAPGFVPSLSTVAPAGRDAFFERLLEIKKQLYRTTFQLQFSLHSTDPAKRDTIIPIKKWSYDQIAAYGTRFYDPDGRKITLNFILAKEFGFEPETLLTHFLPETFFIKLTPLNPTYAAKEHALAPGIAGQPIEAGEGEAILRTVEALGYDAILSVGEQEENRIGSNCGQYVKTYLHAKENEAGAIEGSYNTLNYG